MTKAGPWVRTARQEVRRAVAWHRGLLAGGLAAASVAFTIAALSPTPPRTELVLTAAHDLAAGAALTGPDLRALAVPPPAVPAGALRPGAAVEGRLLAGPVRRGEPLTDVRLVGPSLLSALGTGVSPRVAVPVRIADAGSVGLVRPGDVIDVLAATGTRVAATPLSAGTDATANAGASVVARDVPVLTIPGANSEAGHDAGSEGALVVVATTPEVATRLAGAGADARLSLTMSAR